MVWLIFLALGTRSTIFTHLSYFLAGIFLVVRGIHSMMNLYIIEKEERVIDDKILSGELFSHTRDGRSHEILINGSMIVIVILFFIGSHMCVRSSDIVFSNIQILLSQIWNSDLKVEGHLSLYTHIIITTLSAILIHFASVKLVNRYCD